MAFAIFSHQFTVASVPVTVDVDTRLNIKKRREHFVYRSATNNDRINIAYLGGQDSNANINLVISDRSTSLTQNRIPEVDQTTTVTGYTFTTNVDKFLITNVYTTITPTQPEQPLFYVHTLKDFNTSTPGIGTTTTLVSLEFLDYQFNSTTLSDYILDVSTGKLYNNLQNTFDLQTGIANITFVKYTVKTVSGTRATISVYHELIDNAPIYELASFDDINEDGTLKTDVQKYLTEEHAGVITVTLPVTDRYTYRELPSSREKLLPPAYTDITSPWYPRVTNGKFIANIQKTKGTYVAHTYYVAEFNNQTFQPYPPYKLQTEEISTWVTKRIVKTAKNIAYDPAQQLYVNCIVLDRTYTAKYAFTNNPDVVGAQYLDTAINYTEEILSIDQQNGFLEVNQEILVDDKIYVTYYTTESEYEFTEVDCNPVNNLEMLNQRLVVYIEPETDTSLEKSIYYLIVDPLGRIQYSSQAHDNAQGLDDGTVKMLAEDFSSTGSPTHTFYYDRESTASGLAFRSSFTDQSALEDFSFIDKYTVESQLCTTLATISGTAYLNYQENPQYLVLADIYVGESQRPEGLSVFDIRKQGGGIKPTYLEEALEEQPEVQWYYDKLQNRPYPGATAFYVEVPETILKENGGRFEKSELTALIEKHMQLGGYAVTKTYGIEPAIISGVLSSGTISISWPSYGSDVTYNVYAGNTLDGIYSQQTSAVLTDDSNGNWYTVSGLTQSTKYYLYVESMKDDISSYGPTVALTTTAHS